MTSAEFFRPRTSVFTAWIGYGLLAGALAQAFWTANIDVIVFTLIFVTILGASIYFVIHRPSLLISDEGVVIQNPFRRVELSWREVTEIETQYALTFYTKDRKYVSWAALAPGRYHHRTVKGEEVKFMIPKDVTLIRAGDSPRSDSGAAAHIARLRWQAFKKRHDA
jgi:hypothetical protein